MGDQHPATGKNIAASPTARARLAGQTECRRGEGHPEKGLNSTLPECAFVVIRFIIHHFWEYSETFSQIIERGSAGKV
jgi:hypothetical protein